MAKSYLLYVEIEAEDNQMDCIYFSGSECLAQPHSIAKRPHYKPTDEDQKLYCKNGNEFKACPRFTAYQEHVKSFKLFQK
jgi:hypothetical protein